LDWWYYDLPGEFYVNLADEKLWFGWATGDTSANTYSTGVTQIYPQTGLTTSSTTTINSSGGISVSGNPNNYFLDITGCTGCKGWTGQAKDNFGPNTITINGAGGGGSTSPINLIQKGTYRIRILGIIGKRVLGAFPGPQYGYLYEEIKTLKYDGTSLYEVTTPVAQNYLFEYNNITPNGCTCTITTDIFSNNFRINITFNGCNSGDVYTRNVYYELLYVKSTY